MARLHILEQSGLNLYRVVVHAPTPNGNNSAGVAWTDAIKNSGLAQTVLSVGNGPGQITTAEANTVSNGTVIEAPFLWEDNPSWTNQERQADLNSRAINIVNEVTADLQRKLKFFGFTVS